MGIKGNRSVRFMATLAAAASVALGATAIGASPAGAHHANEKATFFEFENEGWGYLDVDAGSAVADLRQKYTCWWWGCPDFNDKISSVTTRGSAAMLFEHINFEGKIVCVQPHSMRNMSAANFDDTASSVLVRSGSAAWERGCPSQYNGRTVKII